MGGPSGIDNCIFKMINFLLLDSNAILRYGSCIKTPPVKFPGPGSLKATSSLIIGMLSAIAVMPATLKETIVSSTIKK